MKVLLIEDEPKTAQSIKSWLEEAQVEVDLAFDGFTGKRLLFQNNYDVVISDIILPHLSGIELCKQIRETGNQIPVILLSALSQPEDKVIGLDAGADDYVSKPIDFNELLARLKALVRRSTLQPTPQKKLKFSDLELNLDTFEVFRGETKITLTPREFSLLEFFIKNQGRVLSKPEILEHVWNLDVEINTNVVEVYVNYLRNKVDKNFTPKLIHTHFGVGYILK